MKLQDFYKNKKVFITGHTGFKGSWLALFLKELGADVTGYSLAPIDKKNSLYSITNLNDKIRSVIADIRDLEKLTKEIQLSSPDIIFHLAAQPLVRDSYKDPIDTYSSNVMGTINLLDAILNSKNNVKAVINITTDKCYENQEREAPYKEDDKLGGHDPYSASKACSEIITASYRKSFFADKAIGLASARAGNVIGGGDFSKDRIIPDLIRSIQKKETTTIRSPNAIRPWQHVFDALYGYLLLGQKLFDNPKQYSTAYNFSPIDNKVVNVENLVQDILKTLQIGKYQIDKSFANLHEAQILKLDSSKASKELNWIPKFNVDKSIEETALWYKSYLELEKIDGFSYKHLKYYLNLI
jgi:CDP-glucose 4,6-dehydratase